jgi:hypothetical protein
MSACLAGGDRAGALQQYDRLRDWLRVDLRVGPEVETVALYRDCLDREDDARLAVAEAAVRWNEGDLDAVQVLAQQAHRQALAHRLPRELGEASTLLGLVGAARGSWQDVFRAEFAEAVHLAPAMTVAVLDGHLCLAEEHADTAEPGALADLATELHKLSEESGSLPGLAFATRLLGDAHLLAGHLGDAQELLTRAMGLSREAGSTAGEALAMTRVGEVSLAKGRHLRAKRDLTAARVLAGTSDLAPHLVVRALAGWVAAHDGRGATEAVRSAERALAGTAVCGPCSFGYLVAVTKGAAGAGDPATASGALAKAEKRAEMSTAGASSAAVREARAAVCKVEGDREQAAALLREAVTAFAAAGRPLDAERCRAASR